MLIGVYVVVLLSLMETTTYDIWGGLIVAPVLVVLTIPTLRRQARRDADPRLATILYWGFAAKLSGAVGRYLLGYLIYDNRGDAFKYSRDAVALLEQWSHGHVDIAGAFETQETFITFITAIGHAITRPSILAGFLLFSWLGFWGLYLFYRAFRLAVPEGRPATYAKLIFFLPSLIFWPSSIGKEAWMLFTLGLASYGVAHLLTRVRVRGFVLLGLGLLGAGVVRPHVAGIAAIALVCAFIVKRPAPSFRQMAPLVKIVTLGAVVLVAAFFVQRTEQFLTGSGLPVQGGLTSVQGVQGALGEASSRTEQGGSEFTIPGLASPGAFVVSFGTVLFRPLPIEAANLQTMMAALESTFLIGLIVIRARWVKAALWSMRRQPYVAYLVAFLFGGVLVLTSVANFGIIARQRTLLLPALAILVSIPPAITERATVNRRSEQAAGVGDGTG